MGSTPNIMRQLFFLLGLTCPSLRTTTMATASADAADNPQPKEATSRSCADAAATAATPSRSSHEELSAGEPPSRATSHANGRDERNREPKHDRAAPSLRHAGHAYTVDPR